MQPVKGEPVPEEKETGRVEAFSDGVFGIAMTLLALDADCKMYKIHGTGGRFRLY